MRWLARLTRLSLLLGIILGSTVAQAATLSVCPTNGRWLCDATGKAVYLTGQTGNGFSRPNPAWAGLQDFWNANTPSPPDANDYAAAFAQVVADGHNFVRLWTWELTAFGIDNTWFSGGTYWRVPLDQMPWPLVGSRVDTSSGTSITVGVYDLTQVNQPFFDRVRTRVLAAVTAGLTPSVMLFEGLGSDTFKGEWSHPMFNGNNSNGVSADANANGHLEELHTLADATITNYQDAYIRKMIDTVNDLPIIWEIGNEDYFDSTTFKNHVADVITAYELSGGRQSHPILFGPQAGTPVSNAPLFTNTHVQIVTPVCVGTDNYDTNPPASDGSKVVFYDSDHTGTGCGTEVVAWPWKVFTRAIYALFLNCPTATCSRESDATRTTIRTAMAQVLRYANKIPLVEMVPETGTAIFSSGYGLSKSCANYLMYMPTEGSNTIDLTACSSTVNYLVEFMDPASGAITTFGYVAGGASRSFNPSWTGAAVVYLSIAQVAFVGQQFNGDCTTIVWTPNIEVDLAGYKIYDRSSPSVGPTFLLSVGAQTTSIACSTLHFNAGQHYVSVSAFDTTGNESALSADLAFYIIKTNAVSDLRVTVINATDMTLTFTEVDDGASAPATYAVRYATPSISWGSAPDVTSGTCATPVAGTMIGASKSCTITGLATTTPYQFQLVPFRGTLGSGAVFGPLSNIASGTTGGTPPADTGRITQFSDAFTRADGGLGTNWTGGYTGAADLQIVSNAVRSTNLTGDALQTVNAVTLPNDAWMQATLKTIAGAGINVPRLLLSFSAPPAFNGYEFVAMRGVSGRTSRIAKWVNSAWTELSFENATTWAGGDVVRIERHGLTLTFYRNGGLLSALTVDDATFMAGGRGGLLIYVNSATADSEWDDVSMGIFGTVSADVCGCDNH